MDAMRICGGLWLAFVVVWLTWALRATPVKRSESAASRLSYTILTLAGAYAMFATSDPRWLQSPIFPAIRWLQTPIFPAGPRLQFLAILITAMGIGVAIWARMYLGGNWSSSVTIKVGTPTRAHGSLPRGTAPDLIWPDSWTAWHGTGTVQIRWISVGRPVLRGVSKLRAESKSVL